MNSGNHLTSLGLTVLLCKVGMITPAPRSWHEDEMESQLLGLGRCHWVVAAIMISRVISKG